MPDLMDLVQQRQQEMLDHLIANARNRPNVVSACICEECDGPIPEARRAAIVGVTRCAACQKLHEHFNIHFKR